MHHGETKQVAENRKEGRKESGEKSKKRRENKDPQVGCADLAGIAVFHLT